MGNRIVYDKEADSLLILWAENVPAVSRDIGSEFWLREVPKTNEIIGIEIENFRAFAQKHQLFPQPLGNEELEKKALASMDNCYLEVGTHMRNVVSRQTIPPALRKKIYHQILALLPDIGETTRQEGERISKDIGDLLIQDKDAEAILGEIDDYFEGQRRQALKDKK